jgi:CRISPR/Cas system CSM-associated protein Csm2 small subunit
MSTPENGHASAAEVAELRAQLAEYKQALEDLRTAQTPKEKEEAREEIRETKADLDKLASDLGISRSALEHAASEARRAERKEELRPILMELLDELPDDDEPKSDDDASDLKAAESSTAGPTPAPPSKKAKPDSEPVIPHWSEKSVTEMLR